jgi:hypothetical protein
MNLNLDWATHQAASFAVEHWHYSKTMPKYKTVKIGVWEDNQFKGCIVFSRGATPTLLSPYGLQMTDGCELSRVALRDHKTPVSRIVSIAVKILRRSNPRLRLIVSFADPARGHLGAIYQAGNWIYTGQTSRSKVYQDQTGKLWHERNVSKTGIKKYGVAGYQKVIRPEEATKIILMPGKHRYLYPLDDEIRRSTQNLAKPYPKRAASETIDTSGHQPEKGGEAPTAAPQD